MGGTGGERRRGSRWGVGEEEGVGGEEARGWWVEYVEQEARGWAGGRG